jgi:spermidine synthase
MSLGGMLGGMFNALVAPVLFPGSLEYPLMLAVACLLRPRAGTSSARQRVFDVVAPLAYAAGLSMAIWGIQSIDPHLDRWRAAGMIVVLFGAGLAIISFSDRRVRFGLGIAATLASLPALSSIGALTDDELSRAALSERSFFGVHRVYRNETLGLSVLMHGTTMHGAQSTDPQKALQPLAYYHANGPFGDLFAALKERLGQAPVAIVGLGAGELACYGNRGSDWTYYEIDPLVERIARDERYFSYLRDCPPNVRIVIGDARLTLSDARDSSYGLIIVDAFSSDAIPTHLLTREAVAGYLRKLAPGGVLALHISNRHLDLAPVVGNLAADAGLAGRLSQFSGSEGRSKSFVEASAARVAVLARRESDLGRIASSDSWVALRPRPQDRVWSDGYINILAALSIGCCGFRND